MNNAFFALVVFVVWVAIGFAILRGLDKEQYVGCDCTELPSVDDPTVMIQRDDK